MSDELLQKLQDKIKNADFAKYQTTPEEISALFAKPQKDRSNEDVNLIRNSIHFSSIFQTLRSAPCIDEQAYLELVRQLRHEKFQYEDEIIYEYGSKKAPLASPHPCDMEAYFVVKGEVGLKAPRLCKCVTQRQVVDEFYEDVLWDKTPNGQNIKTEVDGLIMDGTEPSDEVSYDLWMFALVKKVYPGQNFGEIVLIEPKPRNVTAIALEANTEVLGLSNDIYNRTIEKAVKRDIAKRVTFLQKFRILKNMSPYQLEKLLVFLKPIDCSRGKVLFKQGDASNGIYLIQEGCFEVSIPGNIDSRAEKQAKNYIIDDGTKFKLLKGVKAQQDRSLHTTRISILEKGESIGVEECSAKKAHEADLPKRRYTVTCCQNASLVLFMPYDIFLSRIMHDATLEKDVQWDKLVKTFLFRQRKQQQETTVWDAAQSKDPNMIRDGNFQDDELPGSEQPQKSKNKKKGLAKLHSVQDYIAKKIESEYCNLISNSLIERELDYENSCTLDPDETDNKQLKDKMDKVKKIETYFAEDLLMSFRGYSPRGNGLANRPQNSIKNASINPLNNVSMSMHSSMQNAAELSFIQNNQSHNMSRMIKDHGVNMSLFKHNTGTTILDNSHDLDTNPTLQPLDSQLFTIDTPAGGSNMYHQTSQQQQMNQQNNIQYNNQVQQQQYSVELQQNNSQQLQGRNLIKHQNNSQMPVQNVNTLVDQPQQSEDRSNVQIQDDSLDQINDQNLSSSNAQFNQNLPVPDQNNNSFRISSDQQAQTVLNQENNTQQQTKSWAEKNQITSEDNDQIPDQIEQIAEPGDDQGKPHLQNATGEGVHISIASEESHVFHPPDSQGSKRQDADEEQNQSASGVLPQQKKHPGVRNKLVEKAQELAGGGPSVNNQPAGHESQQFINGQALTNSALQPSSQHEGDADEDRFNRSHPEEMASGVHMDDDQEEDNGSQNQKQNQNQIQAQEQVIANQGRSRGQPDSKKNSDLNLPPINLTQSQRDGQKMGGDLGPMSATNHSHKKSTHGSQQKGPNTARGSNYMGKKSSKNIIEGGNNDDLATSQVKFGARTGADFRGNSRDSFLRLATDQRQNQLEIGQAHMPSGVPNAVGGMTQQLGGYKQSQQQPNMQINLGSTMHNPTSFYPEKTIGQYPPMGFQPMLNDQFNQEAHMPQNQTKNQFVPMSRNPHINQTLKSKRSHARRTNSLGDMSQSHSVDKQQRRGGYNEQYNQNADSFRPIYDIPPDLHQQSLQHPTHDSSIIMPALPTHQLNNQPAGGMGNLNLLTSSRDMVLQNDEINDRMQAAFNNSKEALLHPAGAADPNNPQKSLQELGTNSVSHPTTDGKSTDNILQQQQQAQNQQPQMSPAMAAAAGELIQQFMTNPSVPVSAQDFLLIQHKYQLDPQEAYQLLLQQLNFQKTLLQPPSAATVVKVSHKQYTTHVQSKRQEVIHFRNFLMKHYTYQAKEKDEKGKTAKKGGKDNFRNKSYRKPIMSATANSNVPAETTL